MDEGLYSHRVHEADIHSSGQMIYDHYRNSGLDESDENFSFMGAMKSAASTGMTFAKGMTGKGEPGSESSWTSMAGQVVGGALGTGGAESGGMAGKIGQMIGGATGTAGGDDGSMGARIGSTVGGMMGIPKKEKPEPVPGEEKKPSYIEQLPGIVGSMTGETRMKGCWKKAYFRGLGEVKS